MRLAVAVTALLLTTAALAQAINTEARDWYVEQKRIQKMARTAAAAKDDRGLHVVEGLNFNHRHKLTGAWGASDSPCETYQLRVFRQIKNARNGAGSRQDDATATLAGDACWAAISKR